MLTTFILYVHIYVTALSLLDEPQSSCLCCVCCVISVAVLIAVLYITVSLIIGKTHAPTHDLVVEHGTDSHHRPEDISSDLPKLSGPFVGRQEQVNEIVRYLKSESVHFVSIYGPPAFGKSTLAIHVGYKMVENGVPVRYIDMTETDFALLSHSTRSWKKLLTHSLALYNLTQERAKLDEHELPLYENWAALLRWAKLIKNCTVLLLDNCDKILHECREEFHDVIQLMQHISQKKLKIIITSQERIKFLEASYPASVGELSPSASVKLLQELTRTHGFNQVTAADGEELASLVGNCPLALKVTAMLLRERTSNASVLARRLKRALLPTISDQGLPPQHRFTALMDLAYNFLDGTTRICSHYINLFPGSFDLDAAVHILELCGVPSGSKCLLTLLWRSLVEEYVHGNDNRFKIHKLIKTYFIERLGPSPGQRDPKLVKNVFNDSLRIHYSEYVTSFAHYITIGSVDAVVEHKFKSEAHNVQFLLQILLGKPLRSEFEAATLAFAYHKKILPDDHTVYLKMFHILSPSNTFHFICKILGMNSCATVYINMLQNLYLSVCKNEPQSCKVFNCDQVYDISHRIEKLRSNCSNTAEAAAVKRLIDRDYSLCSIQYFLSAGTCIILFVKFCINICGDGEGNDSIQSLTTFRNAFLAIGLAFPGLIVFYCTNIVEWFFITTSLTLTLLILHHKLNKDTSSVCKALLLCCGIGLNFTSSVAWITLSLVFLLAVSCVVQRTKNLFYMAYLCFLLLCSFILWLIGSNSIEYYIVFIFSGIPITLCCGSSVLNNAEMFLSRLSLLFLTVSHLGYFMSLVIVYVNINSHPIVLLLCMVPFCVLVQLIPQM